MSNKEIRHVEKNRGIVLSIVVLGTLMGALDSTIVLLAFPVISEGLHSDFITTIWVILIYLLIIAVTTTQLGRVGDVYGRSRMFNIGFALFTIGSALCGFSPTILFLIFSRAVQAVGGSLMQSNSGAIIADIFPRETRGRAYGFNSLGWTGGSMLGIVLGGIITTFVGWQYIFFINVPIGIVAVFLGLRYVVDVTKIKAKIDLTGMMLLGGSLSLLSYGETDFTAEGLTVFNSLLMLLGALLVPTFVWYDRRLESPMIDFVSFKNRILRNAIASTFFVSLGYLSVAFLIIMYLQGIRGLSPLNAAFLLMPGYIVGSFLGPLMGRLSDKYGSRDIATLGIVFLGVATLVYLLLREDSPYYLVLIGSAISGTGTSMFFPANSSAVMSNARVGSYGSISGLLRTMQNIGTLGSFVLAISVAAISIPRDVAFKFSSAQQILLEDYLKHSSSA
jgi:EmrB/QacA subfamily drug resistance transporter